MSTRGRFGADGLTLFFPSTSLWYFTRWYVRFCKKSYLIKLKNRSQEKKIWNSFKSLLCVSQSNPNGLLSSTLSGFEIFINPCYNLKYSISFILWILLEKKIVIFRIFLREFVITIFVGIIFWLWTWLSFVK